MNRIFANQMCTRMMTLASAALLTSGMALAQTGANSQPMNGSNPNSMNSMAAMQGGMSGSNGSMQDKKFAKAAMAGGMAEVQLGQLAVQKGNSEDVKKFGQRMVDDHTKLNDQMKPIAESIGVQPPTELTKKDQALMTRLQGLSGDAFDKAYIKAMLKDHKEDNKDFQMEASSGQNQQEKDAAMQGDQIIKEHLQMAMDMAKAHNIPTSGM